MHRAESFFLNLYPPFNIPKTLLTDIRILLRITLDRQSTHSTQTSESFFSISLYSSETFFTKIDDFSSHSWCTWRLILRTKVEPVICIFLANVLTPLGPFSGRHRFTLSFFLLYNSYRIFVVRWASRGISTLTKKNIYTSLTFIFKINFHDDRYFIG